VALIFLLFVFVPWCDPLFLVFPYKSLQILGTRTKHSSFVNTRVGGAFSWSLLIIVIQKMRQARMHETAIRLVTRCVSRIFDSSTLHPDFRIL